MAVNITSRADAEAIIREQVVSTIFQDAPKQSVFMSMARKLPNMASNYNQALIPAVVGVGEAGAHVMIRRQTIDDLLSWDVSE